MSSIGKFWRNNSLSIIVVSLFLLFLFGQSLTGQRHYNQEQQEHTQASISYIDYLASSHFVEAVFENWESEFLQMSMYVLLTAFFVQKGSAESKEPGVVKQNGRLRSDSPKLSRKSGLALKLYENSLFIALFILFIVSFMLHASGGAGNACEEARVHSGECYSTLGYVRTSQFWFESFQNWQSEFLAVASLIVLSIFLRQKESPESKSVTDSHAKTG
jgi:hypothetical protein